MKNKFFFLITLLIITCLLSTLTFAKSYTLDKAEVEYYIQPNGEVNVVEYVTFNFKGDFSYAYRTLKKGNWDYSDFKIQDEKKELPYEISYEGLNIKYTWHYTAQNEIKIFKITYKIKNSIIPYKDVGEFYWKIWDEGWDKELKELTGFILLPSKVNNPNEVYSWGHPNVNGQLGLIDNQKLIFQIFNIPYNQFVEIRLAFPSSLLSIEKKNETGLPQIIQEENNYSPNEINLINSNQLQSFSLSIFLFVIVFFCIIIFPQLISQIIGRASNSLNRVSQIAATILIIFTIFYVTFNYDSNQILLIIILIIFESALFIILWHYFGREPKIDYHSEYEREIPYNYSPSIVKMLITPENYLKKPTPTELSAEIMYLALKGKIKIQSVKVDGKEDYLIEIIGDYSGLTTSQIKLLSFISKIAYLEPQTFWEKYIIKKKKDPTPNVLSIKELKTYLKQHQEETSKWFMGWQEIVSKEYKSMEFDTPGGINNFILINAILAIISLCINNIALLGSIIALTLGPLIIFPQSLAKRTEKGTLHYAKWINLKKFLHDFSELKKMPPTSTPLWEHYIVYAVVLGEGKTVEKAMNLVFKKPEDFHSTAFIGSNGFSSKGFGSITKEFSTSFSSAVRTSGGSGFSGGGGGGRGGGGGGAG